MEITAPATAPPVVDDPWASLAAPEAPAVPVPVPGGVVKPIMPWAEPGAVPNAVDIAPTRISFPVGVAAKLAVYAYLLIDPRTGRTFFVGKGRGDRCFRHVEAARSAVPSIGTGSSAQSVKFPLLERIREAESDGRPVRIEILRHGLTSAEAELVVAAVDDALLLGLATALGSLRSPAVELGASLAKRAKFKRGHQVVLLRVGGHGSDVDYATARHGWRIGRRWVDTASVRAPTWAVLVTGDMVDSVYRIDGWEPSPVLDGSGARTVERFSFSGTRDVDLETRYAARSVGGYLGVGTPGQVTYVWCGPHWVNTAH
jgi:hypothetical protein